MPAVSIGRGHDAAAGAPPATATRIAPAARYTPADDLWILSTHFNPAGFRRRDRHGALVRRRLRDSGLRLLTVECAFGQQPFTLPPAADVLQVRARDVLWQKERLLNLAIARLPRSCTKVAWIDGDVLFDNPDWAIETSRLLDRVPLVQPFATAVRLPRDADVFTGAGDLLPSLAAVLARDPDTARRADYALHGDTGMAWAARRELLAAGLYDCCVVGGADHLIAHAAIGAWDGPCLPRMLGGDGRYRAHYMDWARRFHRAAGGMIGLVAGHALHLWHGSDVDRRYVDRHQMMQSFAFDPARDLRLDAGGLWEWASDKTTMHAWVANYFGGRREDGDGTP